jgi:hypothetical protein
MEPHLVFEANIWNLTLKLLAIILRQLDIVLSYLAFKLLIQHETCASSYPVNSNSLIQKPHCFEHLSQPYTFTRCKGSSVYEF